MSIFFWFLIIAVATLALNMMIILQMKKHRSVRTFPVFAVLITSYLAAALLYLSTAMHGTQILTQRWVARFDIEAQSYHAESDGTHISYSFYSEEGIEFLFDDTALLISDVPEEPSIVEVWFCQTRNGFSACYLNEGTSVYYVLR